jgi:hypothetical protein
LELASGANDGEPGDVARVTALLALAYCYVERGNVSQCIDNVIERIILTIEVYYDQ